MQIKSSKLVYTPPYFSLLGSKLMSEIDFDHIVDFTRSKTQTHHQTKG